MWLMCSSGYLNTYLRWLSWDSFYYLVFIRHLTMKSCAKWQNFDSGLSGLGIDYIIKILNGNKLKKDEECVYVAGWNGNSRKFE